MSFGNEKQRQLVSYFEENDIILTSDIAGKVRTLDAVLWITRCWAVLQSILNWDDFSNGVVLRLAVIWSLPRLKTKITEAIELITKVMVRGNKFDYRVDIFRPSEWLRSRQTLSLSISISIKFKSIEFLSLSHTHTRVINTLVHGLVGSNLQFSHSFGGFHFV